jgi:hypothetical protein
MYTAKNFIGVWKTDQRPASEEPQDGDVVIEFGADGLAKYAIYYSDRRDIVDLSFRIEGDHIVMAQTPNQPLLKVKFQFERDGSLLLWFNNMKGRFLKTPV